MTFPLVLRQLPDPHIDRGYRPIPQDWSYDPVLQVSDFLYMGESHPTTMSSTSGLMSQDENNADDKGTD